MGSGTLIYLAALQGIPGELYEAAELDGAGIVRRIWTVTIPQTRMILSLMLMLQIVATMQVFLEPFLLTSGGPNGVTATVVSRSISTRSAAEHRLLSSSGHSPAARPGLFAGIYLRLSSRGEQENAWRRAARTLISPLQLSRRRGRITYAVVLSVFIVGFAVAFLFPLYWMVTSGLKNTNEVIQSPPTLIPHSFVLSNFSSAWDDLDLARLIGNTTLYAAGALVFQLVFDTAAAYALSKLRPVLGNVVLFAMLTTLMVPATVIAVPAFLVALDLPIFHVNLTNTPWVIWLPSVANGFSIFLLKRFFDAVPQELIHAAAIDGAVRFVRCGPSCCRSHGRCSPWSPSSRWSMSGRTFCGRSSCCSTTMRLP